MSGRNCAHAHMSHGLHGVLSMIGSGRTEVSGGVWAVFWMQRMRGGQHVPMMSKPDDRSEASLLTDGAAEARNSACDVASLLASVCRAPQAGRQRPPEAAAPGLGAQPPARAPAPRASC